MLKAQRSLLGGCAILAIAYAPRSLAEALARVAALWLVLAVVTGRREGVMLGLVVVVAVYLVLLLPLFAGVILRQDLRHDLLHLDWLRSLPLVGWRLVAAEVTTPVLTALALEALGLAVVLGADAGAGFATRLGVGSRPLGVPLPWPQLFVAALVLLLFLGAVSALSVAVQNLAALLLPGWLPLGRLEAGTQSVAAGQQVLLVAGHIVVMTVGLAVPAALVSVGLVLLMLAGGGLAVWHVPALGLLAAVPLAAETALVVWIAGRRWDDLDPSRELLER